MPDSPSAAIPALPAAGGVRGILEAAVRAQQRGDPAALAVVLETEGSTYVHPGALALFGAREGQAGWLSGGCIEPEIETQAAIAARYGRVEWMDIDTRSDEDLFDGSAIGCRGRLRLALLPLASLRELPALVDEWRRGHGDLRLDIELNGAMRARVGDERQPWTLPVATPSWLGRGASAWQLEIARPPSVLVFGAGPESPSLLPLLRALGWVVSVVERRPRWLAHGTHADHAIARTPAQALATARAHDAALVMHHHFELDREALEALAASEIGFIGLLGPQQRREDLFRVLPEAARASLAPRLHSPIGLKLGGDGPEAIALSIAAQLQTLRYAAV
ncbi:XdhC family protein [Lysobacter sp. 5GHs7-4]|uniref:XdhC family protein n=1 Tax=Lysobacter sp. 5GHs7-4 TaxID=2904253 RepID=UPI001E35F558|nr:XdhC/CoxI family protein [Lysobacter sp. 5GHs7-4]UHQ22991.1 XdhC family protein [Lysobacter sp. 5GHs7-4]